MTPTPTHRQPNCPHCHRRFVDWMRLGQHVTFYCVALYGRNPEHEWLVQP